MTDGELCLLCKANKIRSFLHSYQINLEEAIILCENPQCSYPVGSTNSCLTYSRSFYQIEPTRPKDDCSKIPEAQMALQARMAGDARNKAKMFRTVIGTQTEKRPISKEKRYSGFSKLKSTNGPSVSDGTSASDVYSFKRNDIVSNGSVQYAQTVNGNINCRPIENGAIGPLQNSLKRKSPCVAFDGEHVFKGFQFTAGDKLPKQVSKSEPLLDTVHSEFVKSDIDSHTFKNSCLQKASFQNNHETNDSYETMSVKTSKSENCSTDGSTCSSVSRCAKLSAKKKKLILLQAKPFFSYPDKFIQWRNRDALCWLDSVQCLLVHNRHIHKTVFDTGFDQNSVLFKLLLAHKQAQELLGNISSEYYPKLFQTNSHDTEILSKHSSPGQLTTDTSKLSPKKTVEMKLVSIEGSVDVKTGAGNVGSNRTSADGMMQKDSRLENSLKANQIDSLLNSVREDVWQKLQPKLKFERGRNDSPVFTMSSLLRENTNIENLFKMNYSFRYKCNKCGHAEEEIFDKVLPTLPGVVKSFSIRQPEHSRTCSQCGFKDAKRTMVYERLSECMLMHFTEGLPHSNWKKLDFDHHGNVYTVTGVVQYTNNPDHFIAWLRNPTDGHWLKCDDLQTPVCTFQSDVSFPPSQIHMVMWERIPECRDDGNSVSNCLVTDSVAKKTYLGKTHSDALVNLKPHKDSQFASENFSGREPDKKFSTCDINDIPLNASSHGSEIPSGRVRVPKESRNSSLSSCSELTEDLPEFASVPPASPVVKPIACHCHTNCLSCSNPVALVSLPSFQSVCQDDSTGKEDILKTSVNTVAERDGSVKTREMLKETDLSNDIVNGAILSGPKSEIKPSTVFCVPNKVPVREADKHRVYPPYTAQKHVGCNVRNCDKMSGTNSPLLSNSDLQSSCSKQSSGQIQTKIYTKHSTSNENTQSKPEDFQTTKTNIKSGKFRFTSGRKFDKPIITYLKKRDYIAPVIARDKFMTLNVNEEKAKIQSSLNHNHVTSCQQSSNVSSLGKVQQYLLNKVNFCDSKFNGLLLKSSGSDTVAALPEADKSPKTSEVDSSCSGRVISPISELFGRKINTAPNSTYSHNSFSRKRKCLPDVEGHVKKPCTENIHSFSGNAYRSPNGIEHSINQENTDTHNETTHQKPGEKCDISPKQVMVGDCSHLSNVKKSHLSPEKPDCVLQDLYEALNIPNEDVGNTMAKIMSDVDDLLGFVKMTEMTETPPGSANIAMANGHSPGLYASNGRA